jgi:hypothetical protein
MTDVRSRDEVLAALAVNTGPAVPAPIAIAHHLIRLKPKVAPRLTNLNRFI